VDTIQYKLHTALRRHTKIHRKIPTQKNEAKKITRRQSKKVANEPTEKEEMRTEELKKRAIVQGRRTQVKSMNVEKEELLATL
jgi:hypothetical protein